MTESAPSVSMNDPSSNSQVAPSQYNNVQPAVASFDESADHVFSSNQKEAKKLFDTRSRYFNPSLKGLFFDIEFSRVINLGKKVRISELIII